MTTLTASRPGWREQTAWLAWRIRRNPLMLTGLVITLLVLLCMVAAPWLAPEGRIAHFKGEGLEASEEAEGARAAARAGLRVLPVRRYDDPWGPARLLVHER